MAVAGVLLLIGRASLWVSMATIVTVPIWAILGNILRIFAIVLGLEYWNLDLSEGTKHTLLGLVCFSMAAWAHWSSVQFLNFLETFRGMPAFNVAG
jgi:exosortase/archaeosortase family protein